MNGVADAAEMYCLLGWSPIPIPVGSKAPKRKGWQNLRISADEVPRYWNGAPMNVGILLGQASGGLVDIDLDTPEAMSLAHAFLPQTGMKFGHESKPQSHYIYTVEPTAETRKFQSDGKMIIEIRSTGCQTVFPPSTHPSGEEIRFDGHGKPHTVGALELEAATAKLAAASLLHQHWPSEPGTRQDISLALAGMLLRGEWSIDAAEHFIRCIARATGDEEVESRVSAVRYTAARLANSQEATGAPRLAALIGESVVKTVCKWLGSTFVDGHASNGNKSINDTRVIELQSWSVDRYVGEPPKMQWLTEDALPLGKVALLAALGDTGKSFLVLRLALAVATGLHRLEPILGGPVSAVGSVVIFTAEEDAADIHRRIHALDPDGMRFAKDHKLIVVSLPDEGGPVPLVIDTRERFETTPELEMLRQQLLNIPDLRLIVFDPLQAFVHADINADPAAGQFVCSVFASLATETGATVLLTHHMRKSGKIKDASSAREAVRGSTAIVDGSRAVYALWTANEPEARKACRKLFRRYQANCLVKGAVVKANGPADRRIRTLIREDNGVLIDQTESLRKLSPHWEDAKVILLEAIADAAARSYPFTKTGQNGVYIRRAELPKHLHSFGRDRLQKLVQELLDDRKLVLCRATGGGTRNISWLDVPEGPFARGTGQFAMGASSAAEDEDDDHLSRNPVRNDDNQERPSP